MNKPLSLGFAMLSVACLIASGAALSYYRPGWALVFLLLSFAVTGIGMTVKRRMQRK